MAIQSAADFLKNKNLAVPATSTQDTPASTPPVLSTSNTSAVQPAADFLKNKGLANQKTTEKKGFLSTASDMLLGSEKNFGKSIAQAGYLAFGGQKEIDRISKQYMDSGYKLIETAKKQTDKAMKDKLLQQAEGMFTEAKNVGGNIIGETRTPKQIVADAAGVALDIATAGTYSKAGLFGEKALTTGLEKGVPTIIKGITKEVIAKKTGAEIAKTVLKDAALGSTYGLVTTAQNKDATAQDYLTGAGVGAVAGAVLPPVVGAGLKGLFKGTKYLAGKAGQLADEAAVKLEQYAGKKVGGEASEAGQRFYQKIYNEKAPTIAQKAAGSISNAIRTAQKIPDTFNTFVLDKYYAAQKMFNQAKNLGVDSPDLRDLVQSTRYKATGKASNRLLDYKDIVTKYADDWNVIKEYSNYLDDLDRLTRGDKIAGGRSVSQVIDDMHKLEASVPPEKFAQIKAGQKEIQGFLKNQLEEAVASGRISQGEYQAMRAAHPDYIPHNILDFADQKVAETGDKLAKNLGLLTSGFKKAVGSEAEIDDIDNAIIKRIYKESVLNEKNKTVGTFIDIGKKMDLARGVDPKNPEAVGALFKNVTGQLIPEKDIPAGFKKISYFNNGAKEEWLIPDDIAKVMESMNGDQASIVMNWIDNSLMGKVLTAPARALRSVSTAINPVFALFRNPVRDVQTAAVTAGDDFAAGLWKTITGGKDPDILRLARESGALQGSIFREGLSPEQILKKTLAEKAGIVKKLTRPDQLVEEMGQKIEEFTRMQAFKGALVNGKTTEEAAKIARNVTVDFGKSGKATEVVNKFVPFLNARIQGFDNLVQSSIKDPTKTARILMWTAAYPQAMLNAYNGRYQSYQNIPDYEKRKYWVVMTGESRGKDLNGKSVMVPHYVKIPKGEAQQAVSNIVERALTLSSQKYPDDTATFLGKLIGDFSPVTESSILPAGIQQAMELKTNYSLYKEAPIEPDWTKIGNKWYKTSELEPMFRTNIGTSNFAKQIGKALNWSPEKIDYVVKTGAIGDLIRAYDLLPWAQTKQEQKIEKNKGLFQKASELPVVSGLVGSAYYGQQQAKKKYESQKTMDKNTKKLSK